MKRLLAFAIAICIVFPVWGQLYKKMAHVADSLGFELPKRYGISVSLYKQIQQMSITEINVGNLDLGTTGQIVNIRDSYIRNTTISAQARGDMWILPFVNVYAMVGKVTTFNDLRFKFNINIPPIPGLTEGDFRTIERAQLVNINGTIIGAGTVIAFGYKKLFCNINLSWARTYLDELDSKQKAFIAFPMVGVVTKFANLFLGTIYLNSGQTNKGAFMSTNGDLVNYNLKFEAHQWNYNIGINKSIDNWAFSIIQGFGSRNNTIIEVAYRF